MNAYEGNENYIFLSYAHKDAGAVLPIIEFLQKNGFRVWYDLGIEAGTEWPEYIEEHLKNCSVFVVCMTPAVVESKNCRNEINFALDLNKETLVIYLEDTELAKGMRLQLNSTQSLFRNHHHSNETFLEQLAEAKILQCCREGGKKETPSQSSSFNSTYTGSKISNICSIGGFDDHNIWPSGVYSNKINRDQFDVIYFHSTLLRPVGFDGVVPTRYQIYNSNNDLVFDEAGSVESKANYGKFSIGWIIKGSDGSFIPEGEYRLVASINNSPPVNYRFFVTSNEEIQKSQPQKKETKTLWDRIKKFLE